jgi:hypothetical protein
MNFLFGRKKMRQGQAEVLEDGRALATALMQQPKYNNYAGKEPEIEVAVRVQPQDAPPFEAKMKAGVSRSFLLLPGVLVIVEYNAANNSDVTLADELPAILARNPQLNKKD